MAVADEISIFPCIFAAECLLCLRHRNFFVFIKKEHAVMHAPFALVIIIFRPVLLFFSEKGTTFNPLRGF